ncbi:DUF5615 family PIN-like protein [Acidobacteria bacterium AH-259-O06]|nr:DUF5615 family PIN-like protein [Acidobacteria bacterium AH-259-O06]
MKIKLDENMPLRLAGILAKLGHQTDTVPEEGLSGRDDTEVWEASRKAERFLITHDLDFSDMRRFTPGTHHRLLIVRLGDPGRNALVQSVQTIFETEDIESRKGSLVLATERKIRIRRPEQASDNT